MTQKKCRCGDTYTQYSSLDNKCPKCRAAKKKPKKKKSALQKKKDNPRSTYWKKKADAAWGAVVHQGGECLIGEGCSGNLEAHHLISRANVMTRHAKENGVLLCSKHHKFCNKLSAHGAPMAFAEWIQENHPEKWEWCCKNKSLIGKPDYQQAYNDLVGELESDN